MEWGADEERVAGFEVMRAGVVDIAAVVPLFAAYLQFYKLPSNEEAARRFLHARLLKSEAVIYLALEEGAADGEAGVPSERAAEKEPAGRRRYMHARVLRRGSRMRSTRASRRPWR